MSDQKSSEREPASRQSEEVETKTLASLSPSGRRRILAAVSLGWLFSAVDIVLLILFQEEIAQTLSLPIQTIRITIGVGLLGSALGGLLFAPLGDRIGRVKALALSVLLYSIATGAMGFAKGAGTLMGLRLLAGVGTGGEWSIGFALLTEVWDRRKRGLVGGLVAGMFNLGTFLAIGLYQLAESWQVAFWLMSCPALFAAILRRFTPESPTWLALDAARRTEGGLPEALKTKLLRPPLREAFSVEWRRLTLFVTLLFALMNFAFYSFSTIFINYLQGAVESGGLALSREAQLPYQVALNLSALLSAVGAGLLSDRWGRRGAFVAFSFFGCASFAALALGLWGGWATPGPRLLILFGLCCVGFGINSVMGIYVPELYPTHLRSTGPGLCQNLGKGIGGMSGPPLAGLLVASQGYSVTLATPLIFFALLLLLARRLPEVGGRKLSPVEGRGHLESDSASTAGS
ncbi:MAG: MFS transporter [Myxococcota bacterium]|nr:MFS transporter [Myxococcota bacterium]